MDKILDVLYCNLKHLSKKKKKGLSKLVWKTATKSYLFLKFVLLALVYPLVYLLITLALILPVAIATVERAFSAMKIIKGDL